MQQTEDSARERARATTGPIIIGVDLSTRADIVFEELPRNDLPQMSELRSDSLVSLLYAFSGRTEHR